MILRIFLIFTFTLCFSLAKAELACELKEPVGLEDINWAVKIKKSIGPEIKCLSQSSTQKMFTIQDKSDAQMAAEKLTFYQGNRKILQFTNPPYGTLLYDLNTGKSYFKGDQYEAEVTSKDGQYGVVDPTIKRRREVFNILPISMRRVHEAFFKISPTELDEKISHCSEEDESEKKFKMPMSEPEIKMCKKLIEKVSTLIKCQEDKTCADVYAKEFGGITKLDKIPPMNDEHLYNVNKGLSNRAKTIASIVPLDFAVSYTAYGAFAIMAAKGYKVVKAVTLWGVLSNIASVVWPFVFDFENCGEEENGGNLDDCRALNAKRIGKRFTSRLLDVLSDPKEFDTLSKSENGGLGRVICLSMEDIYRKEAKKFFNIPKVSCQGKTMSIGNQNFIVDHDGHIYKNDLGKIRNHFYTDGGYYREDVESGEVQNYHEAMSKIKQIGTQSVEHRSSLEMDNEVKFLNEFQKDYQNLSLLAPKIKSMIEGGHCEKLPKLPESFSRPK